MNDHQYILDKSSKKHICPDCGKRRFVCYIDIETGEYLPKQYGRCDREANCSYHLNPYTDGFGKKEVSETWKPQNIKTQSTKPTFIPVEVLKQTLQGYDQNVFFQNLLFRVSFPFEVKDVERVISLYYLGTVCNGYRTGAITFPFIDVNNNVRAIQVKQFDNTNHTTGTDFLHAIIKKHHQKKNEPLPVWLEAYQKNEKKISCLFGEHLLNKYLLNPIVLVEAPKTAIYGTMYFGFPNNPQNLLWLAVYNLSSLNFEKCKNLQNRDVILFPDLSKDGKAFELWSGKVKELTNRIPGTRFIISDLLEKKATNNERLGGLDLADYLIKLDWREFRHQQIKIIHEYKTVEQMPYNLKSNKKCEKSEKSEAPDKTFIHTRDTNPESWDKEISELEKYFRNIPQYENNIQLNHWTEIGDYKKFLNSHISTVKANNGSSTYKPYLDRLIELRRIIESSKN